METFSMICNTSSAYYMISYRYLTNCKSSLYYVTWSLPHDLHNITCPYHCHMITQCHMTKQLWMSHDQTMSHDLTKFHMTKQCYMTSPNVTWPNNATWPNNTTTKQCHMTTQYHMTKQYHSMSHDLNNVTWPLHYMTCIVALFWGRQLGEGAVLISTE